MLATAAAGVFGASLVGIGTLFALKYRELRAGHILIPTLREAGDEQALAFKGFLGRVRQHAAMLPPRATHSLRKLMRSSALSVAAFARFVERHAYALADRASHKYRFERRESSNDFLRKVRGYKRDDAPLE